MRYTDTFRNEPCFDILLLECSMFYVINIFKSKHTTTAHLYCSTTVWFLRGSAPIEWDTHLRDEGNTQNTKSAIAHHKN